MTRVCINCEHFYVRLGQRDFSENTPGYDWDCGCDKNHWSFSPEESDLRTYRNNLLMAEKCSDFTHIKAAGARSGG